ncbi:glutathione S-transferase family protein [Janthinobacterium sp. PLB04]|uniref:Glutathione S-transferase family protein n=1 Tax=Janthinobacterium lividum TaxID=29581 RepID=A0AAJ4T7G2_9BURK|nr:MULTISPECIES: glutathione S-transferase family protein [Janthinobacterium]KAB0332105.1 glutathione S-transferase family protein [Janthinobacterium lividum]QSX98297.1 glutathione S-transferase family protein [Janthinobacterium lividum]UGQ38287.1 glutathione S-transferase family protein [Janthinobacterium sp. PLB04]
METTLIYSVPFGCSFAAIAALEWSGLPYQLARVEARDPASKQHPAFLAINPLGQTPVLLTHAGVPLLESMAILLHIAARAPHTGLCFAQGTPQYDRLNSVLSFLHTTFHAAFMPAFQASRAAPEDARAAVWREMAVDKVSKSLAHLERLLAGRAWLASDTAPTIADAYLAATARWAEPLQLASLADYPHVARLLAALEQDPGIRFAHAIEAGLPAASQGGFLGHVALDQLALPAG